MKILPTPTVAAARHSVGRRGLTSVWCATIINAFTVASSSPFFVWFHRGRPQTAQISPRSTPPRQGFRLRMNGRSWGSILVVGVEERGLLMGVGRYGEGLILGSRMEMVAGSGCLVKGPVGAGRGER
ncbi:hypothetical protein V6N11_042777 [Hibiscus sabdariffa]|uniref:Uncharacterized protein n=2 Tax=Hibiscus sabdariffa TaxID=183260 RepID=A0ABR1ZNL5_9ROSI